MTSPFHLALERACDAPLSDALIARGFGPGRYAKAAERLREGQAPIAELSFVAWRGDVAVGCVRLWPIAIGGTPAILLGPFAVDESERSAGVGAALIRRACEGAAIADHRLVLLVGDETYFGPLGFAAAPARAVRLPGPVDPGRVLVKALAPGAAEGLAGPVRAAPELRLLARAAA
jgi:predicted N-acetyltransferase YhbS